MGLPSRKRTHIPPGEKIAGCAKDMLVSWRAKIIYNKFHLEHAPDSSKTFVYEGKQFFKVLWGIFPKQSMYGIISLTFTIRNLPNVGKCTIHGWYGLEFSVDFRFRSLVHVTLISLHIRVALQTCRWSNLGPCSK